MANELDNEIDIGAERCLLLAAPLADRLAAMTEELRRIAPQYVDLADRMSVRLRAAGTGHNAPKLGDLMPSFVLPDENGRLTSLEDLSMDRRVVIAFHRGHWCSFCQINAEGLARVEDKIEAAGGRLVIVTPEIQKYNRRFKAQSKLRTLFLTDLDSGYALSLDLAVRASEEEREFLTGAGWDFSEFQNNQNWILPIPATFVVGQDAQILGRFVDPDYRKRMDIEDLLAALKSDSGTAPET